MPSKYKAIPAGVVFDVPANGYRAARGCSIDARWSLSEVEMHSTQQRTSWDVGIGHQDLPGGYIFHAKILSFFVGPKKINPRVTFPLDAVPTGPTIKASKEWLAALTPEVEVLENLEGGPTLERKTTFEAVFGATELRDVSIKESIENIDKRSDKSDKSGIYLE